MKPFYPPMAVAACVLAAAAGCTRTLYIPSSTSVDPRAATARTDTLIVLDSVATEPRGDTVYHTRLRTVYRTATLHDTLIVYRTDTVAVPVSPVSSDQHALSSATLWRRIALGAVGVAALLWWLLRRVRLR